MSPTIKITKEEINALPLKAYEGRIILVDNDEALKTAIRDIKKEKILGFDTESRPSFKKGECYPASLIQLGGQDTVWLFQIAKLTKIQPIWKILANSRIIKAGVAIQDDIRKLKDILAFEDAGFVEIADLTQKAGILNTGLRSLSGLLLGIRISKRAQVSNWARPKLTDVQIQYAATDAWISRELYVHMQTLLKQAPSKAASKSPR